MATTDTDDVAALMADYDVSRYQVRKLLRATRGDVGVTDMALRRYAIHGAPWSAILRWAKTRAREAVCGDGSDDRQGAKEGDGHDYQTETSQRP